MRSEKEMMDLIIGKAQQDDRVLAAYLKGSRANPHAPKDIYQDFDIMYVVRETESFISDPNWFSCFGKVVLKQEQDDDYSYGARFGIQNHYEDTYSWLLLFEDGNRIDIGVETLSAFQQGKNRNKLFVPLLDKGNYIPQTPPPTDEQFYIRKPSEKNFRCCCNEFFWCLCDVAKGIARDELPFAMNTYQILVRSMLELMLSWRIGCDNNFSVSAGKRYKYLKKYLPAGTYERYLQTFSNGDYAELKRALRACCALFHDTGIYVANQLCLEYPQQGEDAARKFLENTVQI